MNLLLYWWPSVQAHMHVHVSCCVCVWVSLQCPSPLSQGWSLCSAWYAIPSSCSEHQTLHLLHCLALQPTPLCAWWGEWQWCNVRVCTLIPLNPFCSSSCIGYQMSGWFPTGSNALGQSSVSGYIRDPLPAARIIAWNSDIFFQPVGIVSITKEWMNMTFVS